MALVKASSIKCWMLLQGVTVISNGEICLESNFPLILFPTKGKVLPQQAKVPQGVLGRLRPWIFLTFGTTRVVGRQPYALATFTPGEIPGTHFYRLSRPQGMRSRW
jgi:hypothetical protein